MDEKRVIKTIKKVMPSVVSIAIAKKLEYVQRDMKKATPKGVTIPDPVIPDDIVDGHGMVQIGGGTGFIIDSDGLILTNKHVVSEPDGEYTVVLNDGRQLPGKVLSRDPINDVAILRIEAKKLPALELGNASNLQLGQSVIAIGNALGVFKNTVSLGIVSGLSRSVAAESDSNAPAQELRGLIQTDAAINPGNSGGPLVDHDGRVIGVNAAIISGAHSISFAIPVNAARRDLHDIKKFGRICRPLLGLRYLMINDAIAKRYSLPVTKGALVFRETHSDYAVVPGSPAEHAGLREGDIVRMFGTHELSVEHPIQDYLENLKVGDEVELDFLRNGKSLKAKVRLVERT